MFSQSAGFPPGTPSCLCRKRANGWDMSCSSSLTLVKVML